MAPGLGIVGGVLRRFRGWAVDRANYCEEYSRAAPQCQLAELLDPGIVRPVAVVDENRRSRAAEQSIIRRWLDSCPHARTHAHRRELLFKTVPRSANHLSYDIKTLLPCGHSGTRLSLVSLIASFSSTTDVKQAISWA